MALRLRVRRLNRVDLPTLGRPTMATICRPRRRWRPPCHRGRPPPPPRPSSPPMAVILGPPLGRRSRPLELPGSRSIRGSPARPETAGRGAVRSEMRCRAQLGSAIWPRPSRSPCPSGSPVHVHRGVPGPRRRSPCSAPPPRAGVGAPRGLREDDAAHELRGVPAQVLVAELVLVVVGRALGEPLGTWRAGVDPGLHGGGGHHGVEVMQPLPGLDDRQRQVAVRPGRTW